MGSFVVGEKEMCDHQRLNATGYVFSCALPPFLSSGATKALEILDQVTPSPLFFPFSRHLIFDLLFRIMVK